MMSEKGKRSAAVFPEASLPDKLSSEPTLDRNIQHRIGDHLRSMYDDLLQQPVPDRFRSLLDQLDQESGKKAADSGAPKGAKGEPR